MGTDDQKRNVGEICEIISCIAADSKDPKQMQKIAGDIEAIEKICDLLINSKALITTETKTLK